MKKVIKFFCFFIFALLVTNTVYSAKSRYGEVDDYESKELISNAATPSLTGADISTNQTTSINSDDRARVVSDQVINEDGNFTEEAMSTVKKYLQLLNTGEVNERVTTKINDFSLRLSSDYTVLINGVDTGLRTDKKILYDEIVDFYQSGEWNGDETIFKDHVISLSPYFGCVLCDGDILCGQLQNLDLPYQYDDIEGVNSSYTYIPGEGTYLIINHRLVKYVRGNEISLPGGELSWEGAYDGELAKLVYMDYGQTLYLLTYKPNYDRTVNGEEDENAILIYEFLDYNRSELKCLGVETQYDMEEETEYVNF